MLLNLLRMRGSCARVSLVAFSHSVSDPRKFRLMAWCRDVFLMLFETVSTHTILLTHRLVFTSHVHMCTQSTIAWIQEREPKKCNTTSSFCYFKVNVLYFILWKSGSVKCVFMDLIFRKQWLIVMYCVILIRHVNFLFFILHFWVDRHLVISSLKKSLCIVSEVA